MESLACSNPYSLPLLRKRQELFNPHFSLFPHFPSGFSGKFNFPRKSLHFGAFVPASSVSASREQTQNPSQQFAVLLEVEGIFVDAYRQGNREAFNVAFRKLGLDCANWTEPIYLDLVSIHIFITITYTMRGGLRLEKKSAGDEERMLILFFNNIGWPTALPTNEKGTFIQSVLREKRSALDEFTLSQSLPLRPGVEDFIDDAYNEGIPVVIVTTYNKTAEKTARSIVQKLSPDRISKIKVIGDEEVKQSSYSQLLSGVSSGLEDQLAAEATKAVSAEKLRIAEDVASMLNLSLQIDTTSPESLQKIVSTLRAGAECAGVPVNNCVLVAGSQVGVSGAERIGMPCVVVRSSLTSRAEFHSAKATFDGFGGSDLTIAKLCNKL